MKYIIIVLVLLLALPNLLFSEETEGTSPDSTKASTTEPDTLKPPAFKKIVKVIVRDLAALPKLAAGADYETLPEPKRAKLESVIKQMNISLGDNLTSVTLGRAMKSLYKTEQYADIRIFAKEAPDGVILYVLVEELPRINKITIEGNREFKQKEILDAIDLSDGDAASSNAIQRNIRKIRDLYKKEGILDIKVEFTTEPIASNIQEVEGIFKITEGKKVRVKDIVFDGNKNINADKLRGKMEIRRRWAPWYLFFIPFRTGKFSDDEFKDDLTKLEYFYREKGYFDAKITGKPKFNYNTEGNRMVIVIKLKEGDQYFFGSTSFSGNKIFRTDTLKTQVSYKEKELFNQKELDNSLRNLQDFYLENGYLYHNISQEITKNKGKIDIAYNITEGTEAHIRLIKIEGNTGTREYVIRRCLKTYPGDLFKKSRIMRSFREIAMLNYFANIKPDYFVADTKGNVDVIFQVEEKPTGQFNIGAGYGVDTGFTGFVTVGIPNLLGRGQDLSAKLEGGSRVFNISLSFTEPWFLGTTTSVGADVYRMKYIGYYYDRLLTGGAFRLGRPLFNIDYTRIYWRYKLEDKTISDVDTTSAYSEMAQEKWPQRTSSLKTSIVRDSRDLPFFPTGGSNNTVSSEWVGNFMGGDVEFQKYTFETTWYKHMFWKFVAMAQGRSAIVTGWENSDEVPLDEYFRLGGIGYTGVRGYPDNSIGPIRKGDVIGGRSMLIGTFEIQVHVAAPIGFLLFFDAGNVWSSIRQTRPKYLKLGTGLGVRIEIPMLGMLGFDVGYGFCDIYDNGNWKKSGFNPHFQFGSTF